jgi:hypothetical protein
LKQIRPNENDVKNQEDQKAISDRVPYFRDYLTGYLVFLLAAFLPGLHHFYLGNFWRGMKYLFTANEVYAGWLLDLLEMHILIQKSVQEYGHVHGVCYCQACETNSFVRCCCCCRCQQPAASNALAENSDTHEHELHDATDNA